ncbi:MAG: HAD-IA family hydrolase [Burkholderiaceae bacterium]|nr:HAD-IA family hydrolase [Burkholderiaceae bacterium]
MAAVIWDFGGVITESPFEAFERYEAERGLPPGFLRSVNARDPHTNAWARLERSECTLDAFDAAFADESAALGHRVPGLEVLALLDGAVRPPMAEAVRRIGRRLKTGCITNNFRADAGRSPNADAKDAVIASFHHVIESAKVGLRKPDPRIYLMMTDALGVAPAQCVFLDDLGVNLKPARDLGMRTIKVQGADQALRELGALLGFALSGPNGDERDAQ